MDSVYKKTCGHYVCLYVLLKLGKFKGETPQTSSKSVYRLQGSSSAYMKFVKVFVALLGGSGKSDWLIEIASSCVICQCQTGAEDYESES